MLTSHDVEGDEAGADAHDLRPDRLPGAALAGRSPAGPGDQLGAAAEVGVHVRPGPAQQLGHRAVAADDLDRGLGVALRPLLHPTAQRLLDAPRRRRRAAARPRSTSRGSQPGPGVGGDLERERPLDAGDGDDSLVAPQRLARAHRSTSGTSSSLAGPDQLGVVADDGSVAPRRSCARARRPRRPVRRRGQQPGRHGPQAVARRDHDDLPVGAATSTGGGGGAGRSGAVAPHVRSGSASPATTCAPRSAGGVVTRVGGWAGTARRPPGDAAGGQHQPPQSRRAAQARAGAARRRPRARSGR